MIQEHNESTNPFLTTTLSWIYNHLQLLTSLDLYAIEQLPTNNFNLDLTNIIGNELSELLIQSISKVKKDEQL